MFPYIKLGPITLGSYGLMILLGFALGVFASVQRHKVCGLKKDDIFYSMLFAGIGIAVGGKALFLLTALPGIIENFATISATPGALLSLLVSGFVFYGGLFGAVLGLFIYAKKFGVNFSNLVETIIPAAPLIHSLGRVGCFLAGCCYGVPMAPPLGMYFDLSPAAPHGIALFPVQLLEAGLNFLLFIILVSVFKKRRRVAAAPIYFASYAVIRFVLEYFRFDAARGIYGPFSTSQWISIAVVLGVVIYTVIKLRKKAAAQ